MNLPGNSTINRKQNGNQFDVIHYIEKDARTNSDNKTVRYLINKYNLTNDLKSLKKIYRAIVKASPKFEQDSKYLQTIRNLDRLLKDRRGNCVDFTAVISSFLIALGVPHKYRMVSFSEPEDLNHIFIVATVGGKDYILDINTALHFRAKALKINREFPILQSFGVTKPHKYKFDKIIHV